MTDLNNPYWNAMPEWLLTQIEVIKKAYDELPPRIKSLFKAEHEYYNTEKIIEEMFNNSRVFPKSEWGQ